MKMKLKDAATIGCVDARRDVMLLFDKGEVYFGKTDGAVNKDGELTLRVAGKGDVNLPVCRLSGWQYYSPKKKRIYISGKMGESTLSDYTKKKFRKAEELLEKFGYDVFNPACEEWQYVLSQQAESAGLSGRAKYEMCLFLDIRELKKRDAIYMLEDWASSPGAIAELSYALATGKEIILESDIRKLITI